MMGQNEKNLFLESIQNLNDWSLNREKERLEQTAKYNLVTAEKLQLIENLIRMRAILDG